MSMTHKETDVDPKVTLLEDPERQVKARENDVTDKSAHPGGADFSKSGSQSPTVPLRQRHLPASFWKEPNRPKHDSGNPWPPSQLTARYLGHSCDLASNCDSMIPKLINNSQMTTAMSPSNFAWQNTNSSISDYLRGNYQTEYPIYVPSVSDLSVKLASSRQDATGKLKTRPYTGLSSLPWAHGRPVRSVGYGGYSGATPGVWGSVSPGEFGIGSLQTLTPWRPMPYKSSSHYPVRYHPFAV